MSTEYILVYNTTPDEKTAKQIAYALIEKKLSACVNMLSSMKSIYLWEDEVKEKVEFAILIKAVAKNYKMIEKTILKIHPYKCPSIIALPIVDGYEPFLQWIKQK